MGPSHLGFGQSEDVVAPHHQRRCVTVKGYYAWEDYSHSGPMHTTGATPREALDYELDGGDNEVLVTFEDEAGNLLVIIRHIDDGFIGAWLFMP